MDYLREGINLRAMGNQDPLVAWERESFAMFEKLMEGITDDYLRYVFHVQVLTEQAPEPDLGLANYIAADDPVQDAGPMAAALAGQVVLEAEMALSEDPASDGPASNGMANRAPEGMEIQAPIVKSDHEKVGRNQPCWCGSGKKFKLCHGAN
jgi:preprotein translocase subunit SecA